MWDIPREEEGNNCGLRWFYRSSYRYRPPGPGGESMRLHQRHFIAAEKERWRPRRMHQWWSKHAVLTCSADIICFLRVFSFFLQCRKHMGRVESLARATRAARGASVGDKVDEEGLRRKGYSIVEPYIPRKKEESLPRG